MCTELSISELARRSGTTVTALRFYEQQGLVTARRNPGNQRRYPPWTVHRVGMILAARAAGESLESIRGFLQSLPDGRPRTPAEWATIGAELRSTVNAPITQLRRLREEFTAL